MLNNFSSIKDEAKKELLIEESDLFFIDTEPQVAKYNKKKSITYKLPRSFAILRNDDNDSLSSNKKLKGGKYALHNILRKQKRKQNADKTTKVNELNKSTEVKEINWNIWDNDDSLKKKKSLKKNDKKAIDIPHPGTSYNPSYKDHQNLLREVHENEQNYIKKVKHLNRVTKSIFKKVIPEEDTLIKQEIKEEETSDTDNKSLIKKIPKKKNKIKQIKKMKKLKLLELSQKKLKTEKKKVKDINKLNQIKQEIEKLSKKASLLNQKRKLKKELKQKEAKRLTLLKFEEPEQDFNLPSELRGNLRNIKKEGRILFEKYKNLQRRGIIEPSLKRHRKKCKVKFFEKPDHKGDWKKTVAKKL